MSTVQDIVAAISAASAEAQAAYATARTDMLLQHTSEADALQKRQTAEATSLDAEHSARVAYLGNLVAVPLPPGLASEV